MRDKLRTCYDEHLGSFLPSQKALGLLLVLLLNCVIYWGTMSINMNRQLLNIMTVLDQALPFDSRWVLIYLLSYVFWVVNYILMAQTEDWYRIMTAEVGAKLLCGAFFLLIPSTNIRPENLGESFWDKLMAMVYFMDAPTNLFPSIHCLESWLCFAGLRGRLDIPKWYREASGVFAVLVCFSTLLTKQHVIADMLSGILLAEGVLYLSRTCHWGGRAKRFSLWLDRMICHR